MQNCATAPIGVAFEDVDFGVYDERVDVFAHREDVVEAAEADVVGPAVASVHPEGFLRQMVLARKKFARRLRGFARELRRGKFRD